MKKIIITFYVAFTSQFLLFANNHIVNTQGMNFVPSSIVIDIGDTVTFNNTSGFHNVNGTISTFPLNPESFINPTGVSSGWSYSHVFTLPGLYNYQCDPHLPGMVGTITVNMPSNTIYDIVSNSTDHTTLKTAIDACSLDVVLSTTNSLTLFAPTDAAFNLLPAGTLTALLSDIPQLTDILKHHVIEDSVVSSMLSNGQIVTTLLGTDVTVTINTSGVFIDNAQVTLVDLTADNGVVHVIDAVLLPNVSTIFENDTYKEPIYQYSVNILGLKVDKNIKNQLIFDVYSNGDIIKRFIK